MKFVFTLFFSFIIILSFAQKGSLRIQSYNSDSTSESSFDKTIEFDPNNSNLQQLIDSAIGNANFYFKQFDLSNKNIDMDSLLGAVFSQLNHFENFNDFFSQQDLFPSIEQKACLGVFFEDKEENEQNNLGIYITKILEGSAAQKAHLQTGDKVIQIDSLEIFAITDAINYIKNKNSGDIITITFERDGKINMTKATLMAKEEPTALTLMPELGDLLAFTPNTREMKLMNKEDNPILEFGLAVCELDNEAKKDLKVKKSNGVLITKVIPLSKADNMGLKVNDVVTAINGTAINSKSSLISNLISEKQNKASEIKIIRYGKSKSLKGFISEQ